MAANFQRFLARMGGIDGFARCVLEMTIQTAANDPELPFDTKTSRRLLRDLLRPFALPSSRRCWRGREIVHTCVPGAIFPMVVKSRSPTLKPRHSSRFT